jgi:hypothetical protein
MGSHEVDSVPRTMRAESHGAGARPAGASWLRRALVGLWVLAFVVGGGALAARWDALMARLCRLPVAGHTVGGALR